MPSTNELFVLHGPDGNLLRTDAGNGRFKRKKTWAFVSEGTANQQAKRNGATVVRYIPAPKE